MTTKKPSDPAPIESSKPLTVGIVMPISPMEDCSAEHWAEVKSIITEAIGTIQGYKCESYIVSEGDAIGLIHQRIVEGLYNSDIVICDVSCKNSNVMFELGMRLAFDKPTIIIKDDQTNYSFDTGVIEHLEYPRNLRFSKIVSFKELLAHKVKYTYEHSIKNPDHSPFLKTFGKFTAVTLSQDSIPAEQYIVDTLKELKNDFDLLKRKTTQTATSKPSSAAVNKSLKEYLILTKEIDMLINEFLMRTTSPQILLQAMIDYVMRELLKLDINAAESLVKQRAINHLQENNIPYYDDSID